MKVTPYSDNMDCYLEKSKIIDFDNQLISKLSEDFFERAKNKTDYIKLCFEYVRDQISHSADIRNDIITCTASEVLNAGHGICFSKSHLLAALLRCRQIPCGFCYQKLILDDDTAPYLIYHGFNGVYLEELNKWIRLDARGNKKGVNAQFSVDTEKLAFPIRPEKGEQDSFIVYAKPDVKVVEKLTVNKTRTELWDDLPTELEYESRK